LPLRQREQGRPGPERVPLGAYIDANQRAELARIALREDRSLSSLVRLALAGYLEADDAQEATPS
jgi:hypothetical protein